MIDSTPAPPLHDAIAPLGFLIGTWSGTGHGEYPTIESFDYRETIIFGTVAGKPFLTYGQRTSSVATGLPLHAETGYLRLAGGATAEFVLAHPSGIVEIEEGPFEARPGGGALVLRTTVVRSTSTAKDVAELVRSFEIDGETLNYRVAMAAVGVTLTHHLAATLRRHVPDVGLGPTSSAGG